MLPHFLDLRLPHHLEYIHKGVMAVCRQVERYVLQQNVYSLFELSAPLGGIGQLVAQQHQPQFQALVGDALHYLGQVACPLRVVVLAAATDGRHVERHVHFCHQHLCRRACAGDMHLGVAAVMLLKPVSHRGSLIHPHEADTPCVLGVDCYCVNIVIIGHWFQIYFIAAECLYDVGRLYRLRCVIERSYNIGQFTVSASYDEDFFMVVFVIFHLVLLLFGFDISMILSCKGNNNIRKYQNFSPKNTVRNKYSPKLNGTKMCNLQFVD